MQNNRRRFEHVQEEIGQVGDQSRIGSWPDQQDGIEILSQIPGGQILRQYSPPKITIQITGVASSGSGVQLGFIYEYKEVYRPSLEEDYVDAERKRDYADSGIPALEANLNDAVPEGTIVEAVLHESGTYWVFYHCCGPPVSGSGCTITYVSCVMLVPPASGSGIHAASGSGPGPCGYDLVVQYTEYNLATCTTVRTWCVYNPDDCCSDGTDLIVTDCCPEGMPRSLTITGSCISGDGVTLTWNGETWAAEDVDAGGGATLSFFLACGGDGTDDGVGDLTLQIGCSTPGGGFTGNANLVLSSCDPVDLRFSGEFVECGDCASGTVEFVITE